MHTFNVMILWMLTLSALLPCIKAVDTAVTGSHSTENNAGRKFNIENIQKMEDGPVKITWTFSVASSNISSSYNNRSDNGSTVNTQGTISGFMVGYTKVAKSTSGDTEGDGNNTMDATAITDEGLEFRSSVISTHARSISLHLPITGVVKICVYAVDIQGQGHQMETCSNFSSSANEKDEDDDDSLAKLISGVAAGCVFLIPCGVVLFCIMRKDKQMNASMYEALGNEHLNPGLDLGDEESKVAGKVSYGGQKEVGGAVGVGERVTSLDERRTQDHGETDWKTLSVKGITQLKAAKGPTIYVHSGNEGVEDDGEMYSARL